MSIKQILFNTDMVRAILDGRKTVTRRICKDGSDYVVPDMSFYDADKRTYAVHNYANKEHTEKLSIAERKCPICPGDILYVRETWCNVNKEGVEPDYYYYADTFMCEDYDRTEWKWRPSIHMPKDAARIWIKVTDVRVERLQDIDGLGAYNEGANAEVPPILNGLKLPDDFENWSEDKKDKWFENAGRHTYMAELELANRLIIDFKKIWNATISTKDLNKYSWDANPWVWVIEFAVQEAGKRGMT